MKNLICSNEKVDLRRSAADASSRVSMHRSIRIIWTRRLVFNIWQLLWKLSITHWKPKFAD
jgi:hypothetical protein